MSAARRRAICNLLTLLVARLLRRRLSLARRRGSVLLGLLRVGAAGLLHAALHAGLAVVAADAFDGAQAADRVEAEAERVVGPGLAAGLNVHRVEARLEDVHVADVPLEQALERVVGG